MKAEDIMTRDPISFEKSNSIQEVLEEFWDSNIRHAPIIEDGSVVGIVSDRDIQSYALPTDKKMDDPNEARNRLEDSISEIAHQDIISITQDTCISDIIDIMIEQKIGAIPVVDETDNKLLGIVSYIDILRFIKEEL